MGETFFAKNGAAIAIGSGATAVFGWLTINDVLAIIGAIVALSVGGVDIFTKTRSRKRHDKAAEEASKALLAEEIRKQTEHEIKMKLMEKQLHQTT